MTEVKRRNGYYMMPTGRQDPSVSTILKSAGSADGLIQWAAKQGAIGAAMEATRKGSITIEEAAEYGVAALRKESGRVADFGVNVHTGIECHLKRQDLDVSSWSPAEKTALESFKAFYEDIGFDPVVIEATLFSTEWNYAGRCDLIATLTQDQCNRLKPYLTNGSDEPKAGLNIADFKTGNIYPIKCAVQLAAYGEAYKEMTGKEIVGGFIVGIYREKPTQVKVHAFNDLSLSDAFANGFLSAWNVWKFFESPKWWRGQERGTQNVERN